MDWMEEGKKKKNWRILKRKFARLVIVIAVAATSLIGSLLTA